MQGTDCQTFQATVREHLIRHRSILDCISKLQESSARINRALIKAVTCCGCLEINASRQVFPPDIPLSEVKNYMDTHLKGSLCPECRDTLETELGMSLFYIAALASLLNLDLGEIMEKECKRISTLGIFSLT